MSTLYEHMKIYNPDMTRADYQALIDAVKIKRNQMMKK